MAGSIKKIFQGIERIILGRVIVRDNGKRAINLRPFLLVTGMVMLGLLYIDLGEIWDDFIKPLLIVFMPIFIIWKVVAGTNTGDEPKSQPKGTSFRDNIAFAMIVIVFLGLMIGVPAFVIMNWKGG